MQEKNQDSLKRAYATLQALRNNIDDITTDDEVTETYVCQYHAALDVLEGIGIDVVQFRISFSDVQPEKYTKEKYVTKGLFLTKLDTLLMYFNLTHSDEPRRIGFTPPSK